MGEGGDSKSVFPLTGLQIGDMQAYLSDLSIFIAAESNRFYILVDNRPWLIDFVARPAQIWQLMVTKSRLSPFANSKLQRRRTGENMQARRPVESSKRDAWYKLIDAASMSKKKVLLPMKNLRNPLFLSSELHRTLYGFIVFEASWADVRGINYLNELQTDTSMAVESKTMRRWEFESISQAASCLSHWFLGTSADKLRLKEFLDSSIGEVFHDAEETPFDAADENESPRSEYSVVARNGDEDDDDLLSPPASGPYKRRRITSIPESEISEDHTSDESDGDGEGNSPEPKVYRDVLIMLRFKDHDLPFKIADVIMSDLRLLTLLEAGLPSWVIFLQSYPGFCKLYRPWMCPLARALYVVISVVTVLIGFYDLYKNVPVLKATASRLCGPLVDWIETWDMVSRIKYLGTMLFLHNFQKAVTWFLHVTRTARSCVSVFTQPFVDPFFEILEFIAPVWSVLLDATGGIVSVLGVLVSSTYDTIGDMFEIVLSPVWFIVSFLWNLAFTILYPIFWVVWEVVYAPIRVLLALSGLVTFVCDAIWDALTGLWLAVGGVVRLASAAEAGVATHEISMWRSLWNDLFSHVFRALRSILNGLVAFFAACNRHRLSIYNYVRDITQRMLGNRASHVRNSRRKVNERRSSSSGTYHS